MTTNEQHYKKKEKIVYPYKHLFYFIKLGFESV